MFELFVCAGIGALLFGVVLGLVIIYLATKYPGDSLGAKFRNLGDVRGLTVQQVVEVAGDPSQSYERGGGERVLAWSAGGYYISLIFRDGLCTGIDEEISV